MKKKFICLAAMSLSVFGHAAVFVNWTRKTRNFNLTAPDISAAGDIPPRSWKLVQLGK